MERNAWAKASEWKEHESKIDMSEIAIEMAASEQVVLPGVSSSDVHSRGVSPLWTVMTGTIRLR